jgi:Carbohydrate esterase, sialic acid-specific acetylesterase
VIIKAAVVGTSLAVDWLPDGTGSREGDGSAYRDFQDVVSAGLREFENIFPLSQISIGGFLWLQGEADAGNGTWAASYSANMSALISDVRLTYRPNLPVVIGRLSYNIYDNIQSNNVDTVRAAQAAAVSATTKAALTDLDPAQFTTWHTGGQENGHFDTSGQINVGSALAASMLPLVPR